MSTLTLKHDGNCHTDIDVDKYGAAFYFDLQDDGYDNQFVRIPLEDWVKVRDFIDNEISTRNLL